MTDLLTNPLALFLELPNKARRAEYLGLLLSDWSAEPDAPTWVHQRIATNRNRMEQLQPIVDPDFELWNKHAPINERKVKP